MKILHVLSSDRLSGAENVVADICMMFKGHHEMIYCSPDGKIRNALKDRCVSFMPMTSLSCTNLKNVIAKCQPDIIHAHDVRATLIVSIVCGNIPFVTHLHGNAKDMRRISLKSMIYMFSETRAQYVIVVAESCLSDYIFRRFIQHKSKYMSNILYKPRVLRLSEYDKSCYQFDFVYLGRLESPKNPRKVANVASRVLKELEHAQFGVIGDGSMKAEMQEIFTKEKVSERVTFTGNLPFPYKALRQAKCMLMCSLYEGTPISILEAMALGVPVISTPVDGVKKIVRNGVTGILADKEEDLAKSVVHVIRDADIRKQMSTSSLEVFKVVSDFEGYRKDLELLYLSLKN